MSDNERTTDTIIDGIIGAMRQDPSGMERFIRRTLEDALPLVVKSEWDMEDNFMTTEALVRRTRNWYEPDEDDALIIADESDITYEYIEDQYKLAENEPLDAWLRFADEADEEAEYEANTFRRYDGDYVIEWCLTAVGQVTTETFGTYEEAVSWYEENGYQDFTA